MVAQEFVSVQGRRVRTLVEAPSTREEAMCGRMTLSTAAQLLEHSFELVEIAQGLRPRYNLAPTQLAAVVPNEGPRRLELYSWGLVPSWARDPAIGAKLFNARSETLFDKPSFREAARRRRCLVLADGFYEWRRVGRRKVPVHFRLRSGDPFALAGLWEDWWGPGRRPLRSCTVVTTTPNADVAPVHDRMPVILQPRDLPAWLHPGDCGPDQLQPLLRPLPDGLLEGVEVSDRVSSVANDDPSCVEPVSRREPYNLSLF